MNFLLTLSPAHTLIQLASLYDIYPSKKDYLIFDV